MRSIFLGLLFVFPAISQAEDLAEGWSTLGSIKVSLSDEELNMPILVEPGGQQYAFQMDAGGPKIISIEGHVLSDAGTPAWPSLSIDVLMMGPMTIVQEISFYKSGGSTPEMWIMQEGAGEATFSETKLSDDNVFTGKVQATLVPWSLAEQTVISGEAEVTITAEIESRIPEKK